MDFILANIGNIIVVLIFVIVIAVLLKKGKIKEVKQILFFLVLQAEDIYGNGTGKLKYSAVVTWVYEKLPSIITIIFTEKEIDKFIEDAVGEMKVFLETNNSKYINDMIYNKDFEGK